MRIAKRGATSAKRGAATAAAPLVPCELAEVTLRAMVGAATVLPVALLEWLDDDEEWPTALPAAPSPAGPLVPALVSAADEVVAADVVVSVEELSESEELLECVVDFAEAEEVSDGPEVSELSEEAALGVASAEVVSWVAVSVDDWPSPSSEPVEDSVVEGVASELWLWLSVAEG